VRPRGASGPASGREREARQVTTSTIHPGPSLRDRCAGIAVLAVDVDGVLTDGAVVLGTGGLEVKQFHVRDGSALKFWRDSGRRAAFISGRNSSVVEARARELGVHWVFQGVGDKRAAFRRLLAEAGVGSEAVCGIGDDLPDLPLLRHCGLAAAVADACPEVRAAAHFVTRAPGGRGAVREVIELLLHCQGVWKPLVEGLCAAAL
jgi:3-deoxy-D-manno-octulosonate 8-phosphate phosphatase (KDO 8-P phosphatase)